MIMDELTEFADAVSVTGAAGTRNVGDVVDIQSLGSAAAGIGSLRDLGVGHQPLYCVVQIATAPGGADTVQFRLVSDSVNPPAVDGTATVHIQSSAIAIADLPDGTRVIAAPLPAEGPVYERYLGIQAINVGAGALTLMAVDAFLTLNIPTTKTYPDASN